ncbi:MAG: hypothetical protein AAGA92_03770 [Planctomycetota bacterium]
MLMPDRNRRPTAARQWGACLAAVLIAYSGCNNNPYELAPVSGVVTLYGEPLRDATVSFEPRGGSGQGIVGPGSIGTTDENGKFQLRTFKKQRGAVVGAHTVRISTYRSRFKDLTTSDEVEVITIEHVPWHYNRNTTLSFEVPSGGTDEADFVLTAEPGP